MNYAYVSPNKIGKYPLLGSVVRAIGQSSWKILVLATEEEAEVYKKLKDQLKNADRLDLSTLERFEKSKERDDYHLIISQYPDTIINSVKSHVMTLGKHPKSEEYDLISQFEVKELQSKGVIAITGNGKGKTTSALGFAVEAFLNKRKVAIVQWFKEKKAGHLTWSISEHRFPEELKRSEDFVFYATGAGFVGSPNLDRVSEEKEHRQKAQEGVKLATQLIESGDYSAIVLDEFVDTLPEVMSYLPYRLLEIEEVQELLKFANESQTQVIVTGRKVTSEWEQFIKTSITVEEIKHPFKTSGKKAVPGLDY